MNNDVNVLMGRVFIYSLRMSPGPDDLFIEHPAILEPDIAEEPTVPVPFTQVEFNLNVIPWTENRFNIPGRSLAHLSDGSEIIPCPD